MNKRKPTHPSEVIKYDILEPLNLTISEAAKDLGVTRKALSNLLNGHVSMTTKMAIKIAKATNTTAESWLNMQSKYDIYELENKVNYNVKLFSEILEKKYAQVR